MAVAGHSTTIKVSGTAVATAGEPTTSLGSQVYQVTNAAKRIIDPSVAVTVKDGVTPIAASAVAIDYLFGKFTLASAPAGVVTADFSYLPTNSVLEVKSCEWERVRTLLERTSFDSAGVRQRLAGLKTMKGSLEGLASPMDDLDAGVALEQSLESFFQNGTPKLFEFHPGGSGNFYRAWVLLSAIKTGAKFDGLVEVGADFEGASQTGLGQTEGAVDGWGS